MKKKIYSLMLALILILTSIPVVAAADGIKVILDEHTLHFPDEQPYRSGDQIMIPIRQPAEKLGVKVTYLNVNKEVKLSTPAIELSFQVESDIAKIDGEEPFPFGAAASLKGGRVFVPLTFFKEIFRLETSFNADRQEVSLTSRTSQAEELPLPSELVEEEVIIGEGTSYPLNGILTLPKDADKPIPAVVLVHGSGPIDLDVTVGGYKTFRDLAWGLAEQGIAVLRYDKRTLTYAKSFTPEVLAKFTVKEETIDDAIAATELLREDARIDSSGIYIAGHSLGGMLAPRIDKEGGDYAGLIILAGTTRSLWEVIHDQNAAYIKTLSDQDPTKKENEAWLAQEVAKAESILQMSEEEVLAATVFNLPAYYHRDLDRHNTSKLVEQLSKPIFVLQGEDDFQVYADKDYVLWQELLKNKSNASLKLYPGLNHFFVNYEGKGEGTGEEYSYPGRVEPQVIQDLAEWIKQNRA